MINLFLFHMKIHLLNLGCDKNRVDGEKLLAKLLGSGCVAVAAPKQADLIVVNTCGFIKEAKEESIQTIMEMSQHAKVAVTGCLSQRYGRQLAEKMPEADQIFGLADGEITFEKIRQRYGLKKQACAHEPRSLTGLFHSAPLKIAEGCNNCCAYCAIPLIRGSVVSIQEKGILDEARFLSEKGVRECLIVAQDITAYGKGMGLPALLRKLARLPRPFTWIRLMYCHPAGVSNELIEVIASEPLIVKYIDLPLQHIVDPILKRMNRRYTRAYAEKLIRKLRDAVPEIALRTTFLLGFPGEKDADFSDLVSFVKDQEFDRMGVFGYSSEEGTKAFTLRGRVPQKTIAQRIEALMTLQNTILFRKNSTLTGKTLPVIIDTKESETVFIGRTQRDAPEIDCSVIITRPNLKPGDIVEVRITGFTGYDLHAV